MAGSLGNPKVRGPRMGGWIRRGWIWRFLGLPDFQSRDPKILISKGFWDLCTENWGVPNQRSFVYPYPSVSDLAGGNSDHDLRKNSDQNPDRPPQTLYLPGKGETQTMVWVWGVFEVGVDEGALTKDSQSNHDRSNPHPRPSDLRAQRLTKINPAWSVQTFRLRISLGGNLKLSPKWQRSDWRVTFESLLTPKTKIRNACLFIILFVRNFGSFCSQLWLSVRNSVEVLFIEIQEEIHHFLAGWEGGGSRGTNLSGPVLRDTARLSQRYPTIARYGVFGVSTRPIGCDTPSPFSEHFPLGEHAKWRCDTPPSKGVSQRYLRDTLWKQGKRVRYPPLRYYLERVLRDMGGYLALGRLGTNLDGRNLAIVIAESLARVITAIRIVSVRWRSKSPSKTQRLVLAGPAFVVPRFESRDWRSLVQHSFHVELQNGLRELTRLAER